MCYPVAIGVQSLHFFIIIIYKIISFYLLNLKIFFYLPLLFSRFIIMFLGVTLFIFMKQVSRTYWSQRRMFFITFGKLTSIISNYCISSFSLPFLRFQWHTIIGNILLFYNVCVWYSLCFLLFLLHA